LKKSPLGLIGTKNLYNKKTYMSIKKLAYATKNFLGDDGKPAKKSKNYIVVSI
jgi:hypothetical protein